MELKKREPITTRLGSVAYTILGVRQSTLKHFFKDFKINYLEHCERQNNTDSQDFKELNFKPNFVFFLIEIKLFLNFYQTDYYTNKSIEIIANKIGRKEDEISIYLKNNNYKIDFEYPYRYISSYSLDFNLVNGNNKYKFLCYDENIRYEGNFQYRRANYSN